MRSGRHAVSRSPQPRTGVRPRKALGIRRYGWLATVGISAALVAVAAGPGARTLRAQLAASRGASILFGASASTLGDLARATADFGHMPVVRVYYPGLPAANAWTTGVPAAAKSAVIVSFKAQPGAILSGHDDAVLSHFFDTAPTGRRIYYSYYHEPEDNISAGQFTLSAYKAAWKHIVSLASAARNPSLRSTLILMSWDLNPRSGRHWKDYLPGGGIISTLGWDAYPAGTVTGIHPQLTSPTGFMGQAVAASRSAGLPFGFAEFGLATPAGRPAWLAGVASYLRRSGALFGTYFDSPAWPSIHLSDHASIEAWRRVVQDSGRGGPRPFTRPAPSRPAPAPQGPRITGLALSPPAFAPGAGNHTMLGFTLTRRADVTACILSASGAVVGQLARPNQAPGPVSIPYYGYGNHGRRVPPGRYIVLVVASNARGSGVAEAALSITGP